MYVFGLKLWRSKWGKPLGGGRTITMKFAVALARVGLAPSGNAASESYLVGSIRSDELLGFCIVGF